MPGCAISWECMEGDEELDASGVSVDFASGNADGVTKVVVAFPVGVTSTLVASSLIPPMAAAAGAESGTAVLMGGVTSVRNASAYSTGKGSEAYCGWFCTD